MNRRDMLKAAIVIPAATLAAISPVQAGAERQSGRGVKVLMHNEKYMEFVVTSEPVGCLRYVIEVEPVNGWRCYDCAENPRRLPMPLLSRAIAERDDNGRFTVIEVDEARR